MPQVSTTTGFLSGGGVNLRQNAIQIDGAQAGDLFGLGTTGQPGSSANAKSIGLDAVKQYQVLLSPFDVRQGNFGGLLINAITKSGTNDFHGSRVRLHAQPEPHAHAVVPHRLLAAAVRLLARRPDLARPRVLLCERRVAEAADAGARTVHRRDWRELPPIGQASHRSADRRIMSSKYGLADAGDGGQIQKQNPNRNVFARFDAYLPMNTHLVLRHNYASADNTVFSRGATTTTSPNFGLTSNLYSLSNKTNSDGRASS